MQNTANLALKKPEGTDVVNIDDLNYNADKIDAEIKSLKDNKVDKVTGKGLSTNDYTTDEKNKLAGIASGAQTNQNAFSNVKVGTTTIAADNATDTLELVAGTNISITPDATNDKITINNTYAHPSTHPASMIVQDTSNRFVSDTEKSTWNGKASTSVATTSANGLMSSTDKSKLDGVASGANNYAHPSTHPANMIVQDASNRMVSDTEKATWNGKANASHTHTKSQITDMPTTLSAFTKDINFDERYYTETEVNNKLTSMYKASSSTFTTRGTSHTVTDAFCNATSLVTVVITGAVEPQGVWTVDSQAGKFVITSDVAEIANVTFDYYIQKGAV